MTDAEKETILRMHRDGKNFREISETVFYSISTISNVLHAAGIYRRKGNHLTAAEHARRQEARQRGMTCEQTADMLDMPLSTYKSWLQRTRRSERENMW